MLDHMHGTFLVRGWICFACNLALGHLKDDVERLKGLIGYLAEPPKHLSDLTDIPISVPVKRVWRRRVPLEACDAIRAGSPADDERFAEQYGVATRTIRAIRLGHNAYSIDDHYAGRAS